MSKAVELSVQLLIERVSCPGVWLCQDGCVSLMIFVLGTKRETEALPPVFPLEFNKVFHFSKIYKTSNTHGNLCDAIREETIYCELVQWSGSCDCKDCVLLAQYLGSLNDILFVPATCSSDGVDLLMRRNLGFPGILAPKIEIMTKVRLDEITVDIDDHTKDSEALFVGNRDLKRAYTNERQKPVCHTPMFHRMRCNSRTHSRCRSTSADSRGSRKRTNRSESVSRRTTSTTEFLPPPEKLMFESRYISSPKCELTPRESKLSYFVGTGPCTCDICVQYHQKFHCNRK